MFVSVTAIVTIIDIVIIIIITMVVIVIHIDIRLIVVWSSWGKRMQLLLEPTV